MIGSPSSTELPVLSEIVRVPLRPEHIGFINLKYSAHSRFRILQAFLHTKARMDDRSEMFRSIIESNTSCDLMIELDRYFSDKDGFLKFHTDKGRLYVFNRKGTSFDQHGVVRSYGDRYNRVPISIEGRIVSSLF